MRGVSTDYQPGNILLDTMNGVGVLTTVWLCVIFPGLDGYINNFWFKHSNVFKGDVLPLAAKIYGSYYVDLKGTPELTYVTDAVFNKSFTATQLSQGHNDLPVVCVGRIAGLVANLLTRDCLVA